VPPLVAMRSAAKRDYLRLMVGDRDKGLQGGLGGAGKRAEDVDEKFMAAAKRPGIDKSGQFIFQRQRAYIHSKK